MLKQVKCHKIYTVSTPNTTLQATKKEKTVFIFILFYLKLWLKRKRTIMEEIIPEQIRVKELLFRLRRSWVTTWTRPWWSTTATPGSFLVAPSSRVRNSHPAFPGNTRFTLLYSPKLQYTTLLYCTLLHYTTLHYSIVLCYNTLHYSTLLYCTMLHFTLLY